MLTRRRLLFMGATGLVLLPGIRMALARAPTENRVVVVVLRGALDGLAAVPPYGDRDYAHQRGSLAFAPPGEVGGCLYLDGHFGLNPALSDLLPLWQARELAVIHAREKIRVNALNPGMVETEGTHSAGVIGSEFETVTIAQTPLGRIGQGGDIASIAVFLASDDSAWLTGEQILAGGGLR